MNLLGDPLAAGFIWRVLLTVICWTMVVVLARGAAANGWWIQVLQTARILPALQRRGKPIRDDAAIIGTSRRGFAIVGTVATVLLAWHTLAFLRQWDPTLFGAPRAGAVVGGGRPALPQPLPGAGGGGTPPEFRSNQPGVPQGPGVPVLTPGVAPGQAPGLPQGAVPRQQRPGEPGLPGTGGAPAFPGSATAPPPAGNQPGPAMLGGTGSTEPHLATPGLLPGSPGPVPGSPLPR